MYHVVIRTQTEFNALINSSDWLGAESVALIGDKGYKPFISTKAITIPDTVYHIHGFNNVRIEVTNAMQGLRYATLPTDLIPRSIMNLFVRVENYTGTNKHIYVFTNCKNVINCTANGQANDNAYGFRLCKNLINCQASLAGWTLYGFSSCTNLLNCTSKIYGGNTAFGFHTCTKLTNCSSENSDSVVTGFYDCSLLNGCSKKSGSKGTLLGGTTVGVDSATVLEI